MAARPRPSSSSHAQKRVVPKTINDAPSSLTGSMRRARPAAPARGDAAPSPSRVRPGDEGDLGDGADWVSSKSAGRFVNYLPQDEAVAAGRGVEVDAEESQRVVDLLNRELSRLLKLGFSEFWDEVVGDASLPEFLDSFLQFRSRWYDFPRHGSKGMVAGLIVGELELSRRVFMLLYRLSSADNAAHGTERFDKHDGMAILQEMKLFDLPKLLDICAIYGRENKELTPLLVKRVIEACPMLIDEVSVAVSHFLTIVNTMHQRCSSLLEALIASKSSDDNGYSQLHADMLEVMDFINDAVATFDAFTNAYKSSALYFCQPFEMSDGNEELLASLARLHDSLLPTLQQGFAHTLQLNVGEFQASNLQDITLTFKLLSTRIVSFGWNLFESCYLSHDIFESGISLASATKMFPAHVDDPIIRGDILIQIFKQIISASNQLQSPKYGTFLQNMEKNFALMSHIKSLQDSGWIFMDEDQINYLSSYIIIFTSSASGGKESVITVASMSTVVEDLKLDEDTAILESKISQIKDIFPDYGNGFIAACLEVYNQMPEEVIQRILEGTLHEDLLSLDTSLAEFPHPKSSPPIGRADKGKGALVEPTKTSSDKGKGALMQTTSSDKGKGALMQTSASTEVGTSAGYIPADSGMPSASSSHSYGRFTRKPKVDLLESEILNSRDDIDMTRAVALAASQYEYEDEYDDSYDDLGMSLVESAYEESEDLSGRRGLDSVSEPSSKEGQWNEKKPQFYVKDGKNYRYKVSGSVAVSNAREAAALAQAQKGLIHGLGRGGNIPIGASRMMEYVGHIDNEVPKTHHSGNHSDKRRGRGKGPVSRSNPNQKVQDPEVEDIDARHSFSSTRVKGKGRGSSSEVRADFEHQEGDGEVAGKRDSSHSRGREQGDGEVAGRGDSSHSRGRGRGRGRDNHYRKDRAMKKHFTGLTGL